MSSIHRSFPWLLLALGFVTMSCSTGDDDSSDVGGGATGGITTGGTSGTGATANGSGGTSGSSGSTGNGGSPSGGGGQGGGPGDSLVYTCPTGYEGMVPTLTGKTPVEVTTAPTMGSRFLEGPVWDGSYLYVSHLSVSVPANLTTFSRILRLEGTSLVEFIPDDRAGTNGLAVRADGMLVGASQRVHGLVLIDPSEPSATPETLVNSYMGVQSAFNSPNDLVLHSKGSIFFTDPSYQCHGTACPQGSNNRVYRVDPSGTVEAIASPHTFPNGIALSLDERTLYVGGNAAVVAYELDSDGQVVGSYQTFANVTETDGMTMDCAGNLYVSVFSAGRIDVFLPNGDLHGSLTVPSMNVTNSAFGGADRQTLYITTYSDALYSVELDIPGKPY